ncbi:signal recognition particle protein [Rickettsia japonica]|uniref:Signal recognition particle protein n=2 Tax=Rickettsia japonica TaxID=35790 RepID=A0AAD1CAR7_RICJA|nr:signal recognition particle protein [Rickettsia japonica]AXU06199.1 signal recognition particle protein [Rickettsia japonica]QHE24878.1 signal recognition particle protein [Rickettsia japonica]BAK96400.1 signal recognition particle protein [Rickettsia japonica YH]BAW82449.1 signal recognition particle protein [Rickettsia japonica]
MFKTLTQNLTKIFDKLVSSGILTEAQIDVAMRDIRVALLESDVALPVIKDFIAEVKQKALGQEIIKSVSPGQMIIKIIHEEMINLLASSKSETKLNLNSKPPVNFLMVGLQGSGKTTASSKLALRLRNQNKKVLLVSLDTYRPAAQEQLAILANSVQINSLPIVQGEKPLDIVKRAIAEAKISAYDVVIYDTAGRTQIDKAMMEEALAIKKIVEPTETLLVIDSMTGQDAVVTASSFNEKLEISGLILSRIDGDSKGGAALSVKYITKKPIKFLSSGENLTDLEEFDAERLASRILDMGDIVSFVEKAASIVDREEAEKTAAKLKKGKFDLNDYLQQMRSIKKMGGFGSILSMLPGSGKIMDQIDQSKLNSKIIEHQEAIILSMTPKERKNPDIINASRRKRIAAGAGTTVQKVNILLKQYKQISEIMKKASKMNPKNLLRSGIGKLFS